MAMNTQPQYYIDIEQVYKWWSVFHEEGEVCEVRCIGAQKTDPTFSGYYKNIDNLIRDICKVSLDERYQIYFVLNKIKDECYDRKQCEHMIQKPSNTTSDKDIEGIKWIFLDFDANHSSGIGSTNEQVELAKKKAHEVCKFLRDNGFQKPVVGMSGNGFHAYLRVSLANDDESEKLIIRFTSALGMLFSDDNIKIDPVVKNAGRLGKLFGSMARKGRNSPQRPWRYSKLVQIPDEILPNDKAYIQKIANMFPEEKPAPSRENNFGRSQFDIVEFLDKHGIEYRTVGTSLGTRYILNECPFDPNHKDPDSMVFQHTNGALEFKCFHSSCDHYHWKEFRLHFEPDAYDKKDYREFRSKQQYYEKYEPVKIKEETSENGKKWLDWDDIQDINDADLIAIKSGYFLLDKLIKGFVLGELSIMCGLNSSGKSTILNSFALNAIQRNYPTAYFSGELRPQRLKQWIAQVAAGRTNVTKNPETERSYDVNPNVLPKISEWINGKLKIYSHEKYGNLSEQLVNDIIECIKNFGVKFILIDNLMSVSLDGESGDKNDKQKNFVIKVANVAKTYGVHIMLVVHPRKENGLQFLRKESVKGAGDITDAADNVFLIHRVGDDFEKRATEFLGKDRVANLILYDNVIEIAKNRDYGVSDMFVGLYFEQESRRYKNSKAESIHYDWEEHYEEYTVPEEPQPLPTTIQPNQSFDTPIEPLYPQQDDAYWGQFRNDTDNYPF